MHEFSFGKIVEHVPIIGDCLGACQAFVLKKFLRMLDWVHLQHCVAWYTYRMNITQIAQQILASHYSNRPVPVDVGSIARSMGLGAQTHTGDFKAIWSGTAVEGYGSTLKQQKFALAYALAQRILYGGVGEHTVAQWTDTYDPKVINARRLAEELLVPTYPLKIVVEDQGCTQVAQMAATFDVSEVLVVERLKRQGYIR